MFEKIFHRWDKTSFYLPRKVFYILVGIAVLFITSYYFPALFNIAVLAIICLLLVIALDTFLLYRVHNGMQAYRYLQHRLSNGDPNKILVTVENNYPYHLHCELIDELPFQFQERNWKRYLKIGKGDKQQIEYYLTPVERGEYNFGNINLFVHTALSLVNRRFTFHREQTVKVYPSYIQMRRYQLHAVASHLQQSGVKRMRRLGHSMEFEQIKEYVRGDDIRSVNWKATARKGGLMVNHFVDERSQPVCRSIE